MLLGLTLNYAYPIIPKPLSLSPVLISYNLIMIVLSIALYRKKTLNESTLEINLNLSSKYLLFAIFPIIFPLLSIMGTSLMNNYGNNFVLLIMLLLIPIYLILITFLREKIYQFTYPIAISMIGLALLFMHSLTSFHIFGVDIHEEFYCFSLTLNNLHWGISSYPGLYNSSLVITILPTVYYSLSNINPEYIFKLFFPLLGFISPLCIYIFSKRYFNNYYAFLASLLFIFQIPFIFSQQSSLKTMFAILFSNLAIMTIFDDKIRNIVKAILILVFMISIIFSHYTSSYIFFIIILSISISILFKKRYCKEENNSKLFNKYFSLSLSLCLLFFTILFLWYAQITQVPFQTGIHFLQTTIQNFGDFFNLDMRSDTQLAVVGVGLTKIPTMISTIVYDSIFGVIGLGLITLIVKYENYRSRFEIEYLIGAIISIILLLLFLVVPYLSVGYGGTRLFLLVLIFLAPLFIIGSKSLAKIISKPIPKLNKKLAIIIPVLLLISSFSCATYIQYQFMGVPYSQYYDTNSQTREELYISNNEYLASLWLNTTSGDYKIHSDIFGYYRIKLLNFNLVNMDPYYFDNNKTKKGYIYLTNANINGRVYPEGGGIVQTNWDLINNKSKIFDGGSSQIWFSIY